MDKKVKNRKNKEKSVRHIRTTINGRVFYLKNLKDTNPRPTAITPILLQIL